MAERTFADAGVVRIQVCEIYRDFGNAYAMDTRGQRFLLNESSTGVDINQLELGQSLVAHVSQRNYVTSVDH